MKQGKCPVNASILIYLLYYILGTVLYITPGTDLQITMLGVHVKVPSYYQKKGRRSSSLAPPRSPRQHRESRQSLGYLNTLGLSRRVSELPSSSLFSPRSPRLLHRDSRQSLGNPSNLPPVLSTHEEVPNLASMREDAPFSERQGAVNTTIKVLRDVSVGLKLRRVKGEPVGFFPSSRATEQVDYIFHLIEVRLSDSLSLKGICSYEKK